MERTNLPSPGSGRAPGRSPLLRIFLAILTVAVLAAAISACGPQPSEPEPAVAGTPATGAVGDAAGEPEPVDDGEPGSADANGTDPAQASQDTPPADASASESAADAPATPASDDTPADASQASTDAATTESAPAPSSDVGVPSDDPYTEIAPLTDEPRTTFDGAEDVLQSDTDYLARIVTSKGTLVVDLYESRVPNTVNNFVFLALHRFYDGVPFHRVLEDFMAQTGDPTGTGRGGPGYRFADEIDPELSHDAAGVLSMANAGPDTNGSQFFITFTATPWLDGNHAVFGRVVEGMDVLDQLTRVSPDEPVAVAKLDEPVGTVVDQGVALSGSREQTLEARLTDALGTTPVVGQSFTLDGYRGVIGRAGERPAVGFFEQPDRIEHVDVLVRTPSPDSASPEQEP